MHREAVNDRLDAIETSATENGRRLKLIDDSTAKNGGLPEKVEDMLGHLPNGLEDIQVNRDGDKRSGDQGQHYGAASARGSMWDKLWLKERITAWNNP